MHLTRPLVATTLGLALLAAGGRAGAGAGRALDQYFQGRVVAFDAKSKTVSLRYDFSTEAQAKEWTEGVPFPVEALKDQSVRWFDQKLEIKGSTGARHVAEWTGDLVVSALVTPDADRDVGAYLQPGDETDNFATYTLNETYFHAWDGKGGGNHSILKFGKQWREAGSTSDYIGFRYVDQRPPPSPIVAGRPVALSFGRSGGKLLMTVPEFDLKGADLGVKFKTFRPGFYAIKGRLLVDDVVLTGRLTDAWLAKERVELRTEKPIDPSALAGIDAETQGQLDAYAGGKAGPDALVKLVGDTSRAPAVREAAARTLSAGPKKAVRRVLDLLYSGDAEARSHGIAIVKALLGKDYGFNPKGTEDARSAAIQKMNKDWADHPEQLEG